MDGILYIPYVNTNLDDDSFDYNGPSFDYVSKLNEVGSNIIGGQYYQNHRPNNSIGFNIYNNKNSSYSDQISFYELNCSFFDSDDNQMTIDKLLSYYKSKENFILIFSFDQDNTDEECLVELKSWISESNKVNNMPSETYSDEIKISLLPRRQFKLKIGKANTYLEECILYNTFNDKVIIFVKEITFYK